jgi:hypothetical protein
MVADIVASTRMASSPSRKTSTPQLKITSAVSNFLFNGSGTPEAVIACQAITKIINKTPNQIKVNLIFLLFICNTSLNESCFLICIIILI